MSIRDELDRMDDNISTARTIRRVGFTVTIVTLVWCIGRAGGLW